MGNAFLYGNGSSGGKGADLTVNAPAGSTVTVSKDGKSKTKVAGSDGIVVFKGLQSGTWTLTSTNGEQTASKTVEIVADYATSITFFAATIHITYPAGSACTATDGTTTITAPDTSGTWACAVPNAGTWTISCGIIQKAVTVSTSGITVPVDLTIMELFDNGNQYIDITGGWTNNTGFMYNSGNTGKGTVTIDASIRCVAGSSKSAYASTVKKVNLSGYKNITVTATDLGSKSYELVIMPIVGYMNTSAVAYATLTSAITTLPISLEGEYYICVGTAGDESVEVTSVVLEV